MTAEHRRQWLLLWHLAPQSWPEWTVKPKHNKTANPFHSAEFFLRSL